MDEGPFCNCCGAYLERPEDFGTGAGGYRVNAFCINCMRDGEMIPRGLSRDDVIARLTSMLGTRWNLPESEARTRAERIVSRMPLGSGGALEDAVRHWWVPVLRGIAAILFGILLLVWPGPSLAVLVLLFGAYALVDGVGAIVGAVRARRGRNWGLLLFEGLVGIGAGIVTFAWPAITAVALYSVIAVWALVTGVLEIVQAVRLPRAAQGGVIWLSLGGVASILFGILLLTFPVAGLLALAWLIGIYGIIFGALLIALGTRLHSLQETPERREAAPPFRPPSPQPI